MEPPLEDGPAAVESPPETTDEYDAFDPGVQTGYLRRETREPPAPVKPGVEPFDPGAEIRIYRRRAERQRRPAPGLAWPTAPVVAALAAAAVGAMLIGSAIGLPTPLRESKRILAGTLGGGPLDSGIAAALYRGPYHPVRGNYYYEGKDARFGASRSGHIHQGQDVIAKNGTPLVAIRDGVVADGESEHGRYAGGRGNYVVIYSAIEDRSYVYMHMLKPPLVQRRDRVHAGQLIGQMGCTGNCFGTHLHFEVRRGKATLRAKTKPIDPLPFLKGLPQAPEDLGKPN